MKQNVTPTAVVVAVVVVVVIVGLLGYLNFRKGQNSAPPVPRATVEQQYQQHVMQERPMPGGPGGR